MSPKQQCIQKCPETILFNTLYEKSNQICNTYSLILIHFGNVQYYHFMIYIYDFQFLVRATVVVWLSLVATVMPAVRLQETVVLILKRNVGLAVRVAVEVWHPLVAVTVMQAVMMQGNCCQNFYRVCPASCKGRCGGVGISGGCHCDTNCLEAGNCCSDFETQCPIQFQDPGTLVYWP